MDSAFLFAGFMVFIRASAMLLSSPFFGNQTPVQIRVLFAALFSLALTPVLQPYAPAPPDSLLELGLMAGYEAVIGVLIGGFMQALASVAQMAGAFIDLQMGLGAAQLFSPISGMSASPVGQFKFFLSLVLLFMLNAHHMMLNAFVQSWQMDIPIVTIQNAHATMVPLLYQLSVAALQIAAPVAAVTLVIDIAAGLVNKAVPQTQPFLLSLPAKIGLGIVALALGLPALTLTVQKSLEFTMDAMFRALGGSA